MLLIRFVNRAVQAVRQQAKGSEYSPFRGHAKGRSPRDAGPRRPQEERSYQY
jgi:hypothetical protein